MVAARMQAMSVLTRLVAGIRRSVSRSSTPPQPPNTIALMDFHDHSRGGHFGPWLHWFASEFAQRFEEVVVVTPEPHSTRELFDSHRDDGSGRVRFEIFPIRHRKHFRLPRLLSSISTDGARTVSLIMWGYDLLDCRSVKFGACRWSVLLGMSWLLRGHSGKPARLERSLIDLVSREPSCRAFFQPDGFLNERCETRADCDKAVWITDREDVSTTHNETQVLESIRTFRTGSLCIGVFGVLSGNRCVNEVLRLARAQPSVKFVLAGKVDFASVSDDLRQDLEPGRRANLFVHSAFLETDEELNSAINLVDGVFMDSANYPVQSGIVCRALHFRKWILSTPGDSWTNDLIANGGVGLTFEDRHIDLSAAFTAWREGGGGEQNRRFSDRLRDPNTVARCFDELTDRLVNGDIMER